jgi:hypothetical protein
MTPRYFVVTWGEVPTNVAPDGTTSTPPDDWRPLGSRGPILYKPFHVFPGASLDFCAWQLERASEHIYDRRIAAAEFKDRFLMVSEDGFVGWRDDAPSLREAHPELRPRRFPGLAPVQFLLVGVLFQAAFWIYLGRFRPGGGETMRKSTFVALLVVLLGLYLAPFIVHIGGAGDPVGLNVLVLATSNVLVAAVPGGAVGLWLVTIAVLAVGHDLVLRRFRRAEWPPVREDDGFTAVMG